MVIRKRREGHYHLIVVIVTAVSEGRSSKYGVGALGRKDKGAQ
jgi:GTPase